MFNQAESRRECGSGRHFFAQNVGKNDLLEKKIAIFAGKSKMMTMKSIVQRLFVCWLCVMPMSIAAQNLDSLYRCLDQEIIQFPRYVAQHDRDVAQLLEKLQSATDDSTRYSLSFRLYEKYYPFKNDSAIFYLHRCIELAHHMNRGEDADECASLMALRCSNTGMYDEAMNILESVKTPSGTYYRAYAHVYNELAYYTHLDEMREKYYRQAAYYENLMLETLPPTDDAVMLAREMRLLNSQQYEESMKINDEWLGMTERGSHRYALVALYRYLEFKAQQDSVKMMYWLVESALSDVRNGVMDQGSLWELANQLMLQGDVDRSYRYINFTSECAGTYGSRQRSWQIAPLLSRIAQDYKVANEQAMNKLRQMLIVISVLALCLIASLFYVNRQRKRLAVAQKQLKESNGKLAQTNGMLASANQQMKLTNGELSSANQLLSKLNAQLYESNKVKEEYVGRFLRLCSLYIDKMDNFRKRVNKMVKNHEYEDLYQATRSQEFKDKELEELYESFDAAFLHLFPNFVECFNALLIPEERVTLQKSERMNTTLRIFALIRLGVDDSSKIAEFLHYSVNTIYNYRARVKNGALGNREDFERQVREIGIAH